MSDELNSQIPDELQKSSEPQVTQEQMEFLGAASANVREDLLQVCDKIATPETRQVINPDKMEIMFGNRSNETDYAIDLSSRKAPRYEYREGEGMVEIAPVTEQVYTETWEGGRRETIISGDERMSIEVETREGTLTTFINANSEEAPYLKQTADYRVLDQPAEIPVWIENDMKNPSSIYRTLDRQVRIYEEIELGRGLNTRYTSVKTRDHVGLVGRDSTENPFYVITEWRQDGDGNGIRGMQKGTVETDDWADIPVLKAVNSTGLGKAA